MGNLRRRLFLTAIIAVVGAAIGIAGTGHAYLRRWRRSLLWFLLTIGAGVALTSVYVSDPGALETYTVLTSPIELTLPVYPPEVVMPLLVILGFSVVDALLVAFLDQREAQPTPGSEDDGEGLSCPHCRIGGRRRRRGLVSPLWPVDRPRTRLLYVVYRIAPAPGDTGR